MIYIYRIPNILLRYADDTTLMAESEEELKSLLMKVKESDSHRAPNTSLNSTHLNSGEARDRSRLQNHHQ